MLLDVYGRQMNGGFRKVMKKFAPSVVFLSLLSASSCASARHGVDTAGACSAGIAAAPMPDGEGTIESLLPQAEAMTLLSRTQGTVGRPVDSASINNIRAIGRRQDGKLKTVLLPYDMRAEVGDRVAFQTGYLSKPPLCSYVPALATAKLTPN